jgi:hypothetical protein
MRGQIVVPAPRMILEEPARDAEPVGHLVQLGAGVGEQVAEPGEPQPGVGVLAHRVDVTGHVIDATVACMPDRPASIPEGLVIELSRGKVLPGAGGEADRWMQMLNDRHDECVATLDRERMAIEIIFRSQEDGADYLYWVSVRGADGGELDLSNPIDRDHEAQARRTKEPGWVEAEPQVLLLPDPVREAVLAWALRPAD